MRNAKQGNDLKSSFCQSDVVLGGGLVVAVVDVICALWIRLVVKHLLSRG